MGITKKISVRRVTRSKRKGMRTWWSNRSRKTCMMLNSAKRESVRRK